MEATTRTAKKTALIIDDEKIICEVCRRVLSSVNFAVDTAEGAVVAMNFINKHGYDIYIMDIRLPGLNGIQLYNWMLENYPHQAQKVMIITGTGLDADIQIFLNQFPHTILYKPFTIDELKEAVRNFR